MKLSTIFYGLMVCGCLWMVGFHILTLIATASSLSLLGLTCGAIGAACYGYLIYNRYKEGNL